MTLIVTLSQREGGGNFEFTPAAFESIKWEVNAAGQLFLKSARWDTKKAAYGDYTVFRVFADGAWRDVENVE